MNKLTQGRLGKLRYLVSTPSHPPAAPLLPLPVLCFLHGYDESAPTGLEAAQTAHGPLKAGNPARVRNDFIIIAPQLPLHGDNWHLFAADVLAIVDAVTTRERGDRDRTYLTGFSFGANGVFDLAIANRERWAALWPVDPTRVPLEDPGLPIWLSVGQVARYGTMAFNRTLGLGPPADDYAGDRVCLDQGADHVGSATLAYADNRIYDWLLAHRLSVVL